MSFQRIFLNKKHSAHIVFLKSDFSRKQCKNEEINGNFSFFLMSVLEKWIYILRLFIISVVIHH